MAQPTNENKMGVMPENKLLLNMALPMIMSMLVQACYNIVDSFFVSKLSEDALNAVSLAFPVQNLMIAVAVGTGVGINALLSRSLGQKDQKRVNSTAMNGLMLEMVSGLVFTILGLTCARMFYTVQTDIPGIIRYGTDYLTIIAGCSMGIFVSVASERLVQATGRTVYAMVIQGTGSVINLILDPLLIFGLFGFPRLEVAGAAVATVDVLEGAEAQPGDHRRHLQRGPALHHHAVHRLGDGVRHEPDFDRLHLHRHGGFRHLLQAPVLYFHAHLWSDQRRGTHCGL